MSEPADPGADDWCPQAIDGVVAVPLEDRAVLWGPAVAVPELLSPVEATLWSFIDGRTSLDALAADVAEVFDATEPKARADLVELFERWARLGLLHPAPVATTDDDARPRAEPIVGPDASDAPLQSPAVPPYPALAEFVAWHRPRKVCVRAGSLTFAVSVQTAELTANVASRLAPVRVEGDARRRDAILREQGRDGAGRWLVLSDIGLPLVRTDDADVAVDAVVRRVSEVLDRQLATGVAWFRFTAVVGERGAVLLQHEHLAALPELTTGLAARDLHLWPADHVAIDPTTGDLVRFADRFASSGAPVDGAPVEAARHRVLGVVLGGGPELGPRPETAVEWRWLLALYSCIGHDPRADGWEARWAATERLAATHLEATSSFAPAEALAAIDRVLGDGRYSP